MYANMLAYSQILLTIDLWLCFYKFNRCFNVIWCLYLINNLLIWPCWPSVWMYLCHGTFWHDHICVFTHLAVSACWWSLQMWGSSLEVSRKHTSPWWPPDQFWWREQEIVFQNRHTRTDILKKCVLTRGQRHTDGLKLDFDFRNSLLAFKLYMVSQIMLIPTWASSTLELSPGPFRPQILYRPWQVFYDLIHYLILSLHDVACIFIKLLLSLLNIYCLI